MFSSLELGAGSCLPLFVNIGLRGCAAGPAMERSVTMLSVALPSVVCPPAVCRALL